MHDTDAADLSRYGFEGPAGLPDFSGLDHYDFEAAFDAAMALHRAEIRRIADDPADPTFENTLAALERAGQALGEVGAVFWTLAGAETDDLLQAAERAVAPKLSRHVSAISLDPALFARIDAVYGRRDDLGLESEDRRLVERVHEGFVRRGARLEGADRERLTEINARLSELGTAFSQNVLADERLFVLPVAREDLEGLPPFLLSSMREAAAERGLEGHVVTLSRSVVVPFLANSPRRDLREQAYRAWTRRGENGGASDNREIVRETLQLRAEKAKLLGFPSFAHYKLDDTMAGTPENVRALLRSVWERAVARARLDGERLQDVARARGDDHALEPHDWRFLAEQRRRAEFAIDESEVKNHFALDRMIEAAFDTAGRLFGLRFEPVEGARLWHRDARVWRVLDRDGSERGLFIGDYFARPTKRSGAWMSSLRVAHAMDGGQRPVIYNVCNFAKPAAGEPALLSLDDARTLFHEFGHALHGLLSDVHWPMLSGTAVARDFVELPSQLFEHWLETPQILGAHARHVSTGEPLPPALAARIEAARTFDTGFDTVEYTASALVDLALHERAEAPDDPIVREWEILGEIGMPDAIGMRHRVPHFTHVFSGDGYSAGYYSYMWSEVLDADAFDAFRERGDPFHRETAERLRTHVYAAGNSADAAELYRRFRGRLPSPDALMRKRGLAA